MNSPEISVIVPFYREGSLLREAIDSIIDQTFQDFEILLIDNNADEESRKYAEYFANRFPEKIRLIHEPQQGIPYTKNRGIMESKASFIAFLDGDDLMKKDKLQKQYEILKKRSDLVLVVSNFDLLSHDSSQILKTNIPSPAYGNVSLDRLRQDFLFLFNTTFSPPYLESFEFSLPSSWLVRKEALINSGLFNIRLVNGWDDFELLMRLFRFGGFHRIQESLFIYRAESTETRSQKNKSYTRQKRYISVQRYVAAIWEQFGSNPRNVTVLHHIRSVWLQVFGVALISYEKGLQLGRSLLIRSVLISPWDRTGWKLLFKSFLPRSLHPRLFWFDELSKESLDEIHPSMLKRFLSFPVKYENF